MKKVLLLFTIILLFACKNKVADLNQNVAIQPNEFIKAFQQVESNFYATDSNIYKVAQQTKINHELLGRFLPVAVINALKETDATTEFHPIGRISKNSETYLLILSVSNKKPTVSVVVFDAKNVFITYKNLFSPHTDGEGYKYTLSVNKEPSFFVAKEKYVNNSDLKFTKVAWALVNNTFIQVLKESNEQNAESMPIVNPIDTLASNNLYSGDYVETERSIISLRDGRTKNEYLFFMHVEKDEATCIGELKGLMQLTDSTHAIYKTGGDPCNVNFAFEGKRIIVTENGSCANRRSADCKFNDEFAKKKTVRKQLPKVSLVTNATPIVNAPIKPSPKPSTKLKINKLPVVPIVPNMPSVPATKVTKPQQKPKPKAAPKKQEENPYE